jgi:hypothetical protein
MKSFLWVATLLAVPPPLARADGPWVLFDGCHWNYPKLCEEWRSRHSWCPNDYGPKTLPCVPLNAKDCVDDYCRKGLPCVPPNPKGCVDDYCPKTCPLILGSLCEPWYTCGSPEVEWRCRRCTHKP